MNDPARSAALLEAAALCEQYAEVNMQTCGDNIIMDPLLHGGEWTEENVKLSKDMQLQSLIHSSYYHAGMHLAALLRWCAA